MFYISYFNHDNIVIQTELNICITYGVFPNDTGLAFRNPNTIL